MSLSSGGLSSKLEFYTLHNIRCELSPNSYLQRQVEKAIWCVVSFVTEGAGLKEHTQLLWRDDDVICTRIYYDTILTCLYKHIDDI